MYNSKYYTCEQIDQRLLEGYYDDAVAAGYTGSKAQYLAELLKAINYSANPTITADKVVYNPAISGLTSKNVQGAVDELANKKANSADVDSKIQTEQERVNAELGKKFDKESVVQESGEAEDKVMSQKATSAAIQAEKNRAEAAEQANAQGIIFDVSAHNNGAVFESLSALLGDANLSTLIPTSVRRGGMTIRFIQGSVQSSDNNYVQYRFLLSTFTNYQFVNLYNWRECSESNFYYLEYWGNVADEIKELNEDVYFYNTYNNTIGRKIAPAGTQGWATYPIKKNDLCYYLGRFFTSLDGSTLTDISAVIQDGFTLQTRGSNTGKVMSQKAVSECLDNTTSLLTQLIQKLSSKTTTIVQPESVLDSKVLQVDYGENAVKVRCLDVSSSSDNSLYKVNVYDVANLNTVVYIKGSTEYNNAYYAFFTSSNYDYFVPITGNLEVSGRDLSEKTFCVAVPGDAKYLLVAQKTLGCEVRNVEPSIDDIMFLDDIEELKNEKDLRVDVLQNLTNDEKEIAFTNLSLPTRKIYKNIIPSSTMDNKFIADDGSIREANNYFSALVYDVEDLNNIPVIHTTTRWANPFYAFYSGEPSSTTFIEISTLPETRDLEEVTFNNVAVPSTAKYIVINQYVGTIAYAQSIARFDLMPLNTLYGKKWACVGDSLTEVNIRTTKHYFDYIAEETGVIPLNYGVGGTGYARHREDNIAFYQRVSSIDLSADLITIFGSFNDLSALSQDFPFGDITDTGTTTMAGCINTTIDNIQTRFPLVRLGIVSPTPWKNTHPGVTGDAANSYVNLIKGICEYRSIPFLDLWKCSNLRPWDSSFKALAYSKDGGNGVHPDENGHALIAPMFREFIKKLI